jgi:uncharacterized peroxidase-related enzyme
MPQPDHIQALPVPAPEALDPDLQKYMKICEEKLGLVPNVIRAYAFRPQRLRNFIATYKELMLEETALSMLEREMIAVVVSSANRCYYCLVAHGQAVRQLSGDPELGEMMVMNYRIAPLDARMRAILDFAWKLTTASIDIDDTDRQGLRDVGLDDQGIWDVIETTSFFNYTNRMAAGLDMMPNREYHAMDR